MSEVKVNKISPRSGTDVTLGDASDTFTIPASATLDVNGTIDVTGATVTGLSLEDDIAILGFKVATNGSLAKYNLVDQTIDAFEDATGIDAGGSTNETRNASNYYSGTSQVVPTTTGGTYGTYTSGGTTYYWRKFIADGTFTIDGAGDVDVLLVAGGGSGGGGQAPNPTGGDATANTGGGGAAQGGHSAGGAGGGGGAGGLLWTSGHTISSGSYSIVVGDGGAGQSGGDGNAGEDSTFGTGGTLLTAIGGGFGASYDPGGVGGSGGGADGPTKAGGAGTAGQGNAGGSADHYTSGCSYGSGGGGGGAGQDGSDSACNAAADGGDGSNDFIDVTGSTETQALMSSASIGETDGGTQWLAGGGASGPSHSTGGTGGKGGGGDRDGSGTGAGGSGIALVRYTEVDSYLDMTLVSNSTTAEAEPTKGDLVMTYTNGAGTATINTDLKGWVSRDDGTTYTQFTLADEGDTGGHTILTAHDLDISGQPSGTSMRYKITTHNQSASKETRIQAVSLGWS